MAILITDQSESAQACRGVAIASATAALIRANNAGNGDHTHVADWWVDQSFVNGTQCVLFEFNDGSTSGVNIDGIHGIVSSIDTTTVANNFFRLRVSNGTGTAQSVVDAVCSPAISPVGRAVTVCCSYTKATNTYSMRVYLDGVLWGSGSGTAGVTPTAPTQFGYTLDAARAAANRITTSSGFQNARGVRCYHLLNIALSNAQMDEVAKIPFVGAGVRHGANLVFAPGVYHVENGSSGVGARPEVPCTTTNIFVVDTNGTDGQSFKIQRAFGTVTANTVRWVDPFAHSGLPRPACGTALVSAPAGWTVGTPFLGSRTARLTELEGVSRGVAPTRSLRVGLNANSRISYPDPVRVTTGPGAQAVTGRIWHHNLIDYDAFVFFGANARGRFNFQPPLSTDTTKGAWGFDCQFHNPLTSGTAPVNLADTTAARFGSGSRLAGPTSPTYHGPGDPILVPASASYRLCVNPVDGQTPADTITVGMTVLNTPNSSSLTVIKEAAQHAQNGTALSLGYSNETGMPTLGTAMSAASFTGYNASTNIFTGVSTIADAQVGDMLEVCDSSGNRLAEIELAVITAIGADTITVDGKFKIGSTIAGTPANYRLKWCAPGLHKITVTHTGGVANANWRGIKVTSGASGGGIVVMSFEFANVSRPGPSFGPWGWSGRGWRDQYQQMSHAVSARDGKTMSQRFFETLAPDLAIFSVADQGNPAASSGLETVFSTYVDYLLLGAPQAEVVFGGEHAHSASENVNSFSDAATNYNNHHAAAREICRSRGYTYLTLIGAPAGSDYAPGSVWAQLAALDLGDGSAHPFRGYWRGIMRQAGQVFADNLPIANRRLAGARVP